VGFLTYEDFDITLNSSLLHYFHFLRKFVTPFLRNRTLTFSMRLATLLKPILCGIFIASSTPSFSQIKDLDYVLKDTIYFRGYVTQFKGGKILFQTDRKMPGFNYTANDIKEYQFQKRLFKSLSFGSNKEFVEQLATGDNNLYKKGDSFLINKGDDWILLNKSNFRTVLKERLQCSDENIFARVRYSKSSVRNVVKLSNEGICNENNIQYRRFGVFAGYGTLSHEVVIYQTAGSNVRMKSQLSSVMAGLFAEFPVYAQRKLYFTTELFMTHSEPMLFTDVLAQASYMKLKVNSVTIPIGVKYAFTNTRVKPYARAAGSFSFVTIDGPGYIVVNESTIYTTTIRKFTKASSIFYGLHLGLGVEIPVSKRRGVFLETRYNLMPGGDFDFFSLNNSGFFFVGGFHI